MTADNDIGRFLADTLASVPKLSPSAFDKVFNDKVQVNTIFTEAEETKERITLQFFLEIELAIKQLT